MCLIFIFFIQKHLEYADGLSCKEDNNPTVVDLTEDGSSEVPAQDVPMTFENIQMFLNKIKNMHPNEKSSLCSLA